MHDDQHGPEPAPREVQPARKVKFGGVARSVIAVVVLLGVFSFGVNVGNGNIQFAKGVSDNDSLPSQLDFSSVNTLYATLRSKYDGKLEEQALIDGMRRGLVEATGDPYTQFFTSSEADEFESQLSGSFSGIGAELGKNENDELVIVSPISGFPAEKAGLRARDVIISINDESTTGLSVDQAVGKIRGEKGTEVTLGVVRGGNERKEFTITRDNINIPSVTHKIEDGVGYIQVSRFWTDTGSLMREAAEEFAAANVKSVVLDLRGNPGGTLDAAVDAASLWLPKGTTVLQEKRDGKVIETYKAKGGDLLHGVKTAVLINGGSASASEILAGALADNDAATLVGEKSYGKGSVQQIIPLSDGAQVKITFARWFTPNGKNIDKEGIEPSVKVELSDADYEAGRDPQKNRAFQLVR